MRCQYFVVIQQFIGKDSLFSSDCQEKSDIFRRNSFSFLLFILALYAFVVGDVASSAQQAAREIAHGIPDTDESDSDDGEEDEQYVRGMNADRIGIHHKIALAGP